MRNSHILSLSAAALLALASFGQAQTTVATTTTSTDGTVSEFSPDTIVVRSTSSPDPIRYSFSKTTTYVDDDGQPVEQSVVKSGLPVTVHYIKDGDHTVADRVIVHKKKSVSTVSGGSTTAVEKTVTAVPAPAATVEEKTKTSTTTTTTK